MGRDLAERPLQTWADFDNYADGAAVAPAAVFIYILSCRRGPDRSSTLPDDISPQTSARDLAKFCYLVHILRDLSKDAQRDQQLVTIPNEVLASCDLRKADLSTVLPGRLAPLAKILWARAAGHRAAVTEQMAQLLPRLGAVERGALSALIRLYDDQHAENKGRVQPNASP